MQEGTSSLMQMAKVSVAVQAFHDKGLPFITVLADPTYGGVSASYAMQSDVRIAVSSDARIGFAGPAVILNTMCEANQALFDQRCPPDFQTATYVHAYGQVDIVLSDKSQSNIEITVASIASKLLLSKSIGGRDAPPPPPASINEAPKDYVFNYTNSRQIDRPQTQDLVENLFDAYVELSGDGKVGRDVCLKGGLATFGNQSCVVIFTMKGHTPTDMEAANYGMPSPHGYRTAFRLMKLAEKFKLPVITFVDTVGAWPTFECERDGQSEAIASNLTCMAGLTVPIVTLMVGEGGSGGALGICMGNTIGMLSGGYFGVISPEGAASILGRYKDDAHKATQFPVDCQALATAQCIYAHQLKTLGVVDEILWEDKSENETYKRFPVLKAKIQAFLESSLTSLMKLSKAELIEQRYTKYRNLGTFANLTPESRIAAVEEAKAKCATKKTVAKIATGPPALILEHLAQEVVQGARSKHRGLAAPIVQAKNGVIFTPNVSGDPSLPGQSLGSSAKKNAKVVLDESGPEGLCKWILAQKGERVLLTDTTMRDAHQSLLATRVRTIDLVEGATIASRLLADAFSLECWGGATFDVCMRFLDECPWERLRQIRKACPNICLQMLIRGANAVGYTSYPDNVVEEFIKLAAENGMDVFRIFDCFNIVESMMVSINAVLAAGKVAEVCMCYTGNVVHSQVYNVDYYRSLAAEIKAAGAHIIGIKDMAGLLRPFEVEPLMKAIREAVGDMPIHFHTHATSSGSLATTMEMARCGCNIIDFATASMADGTSQPSLNAFVAMMEGAPNDTRITYMDLEPYDMYWGQVRDIYAPFESGMKSGTARVFEHQIPGGQYSNLLVQCQSMGLSEGAQWERVLNAYRDVNAYFGDIVKVTPSSKCVGDLALYLVVQNLTTEDLKDPVKGASIDFPESVVGLLKGDLGFPHRGFPPEIEAIILKGATKNTTRAGLMLPSVDFAANIEKLSAQFAVTVTPEQAMSSLMYPKVFSDYMDRISQKGPLLPSLPTPVYFYALAVKDSFTLYLPHAQVTDVLPTFSVDEAKAGSEVKVEVTLNRVSPLLESKRSVHFTVKVSNKGDGTVLVTEQVVLPVKDSGGVFIFEGPMADPAKVAKQQQVASPMPGVVEKLLCKDGQTVQAGDVLCVISAMKMEVKVSAPCTGKVSFETTCVGYRVVEGALLFSFKS